MSDSDEQPEELSVQAKIKKFQQENVISMQPPPKFPLKHPQPQPSQQKNYDQSFSDSNKESDRQDSSSDEENKESRTSLTSEPEQAEGENKSHGVIMSDSESDTDSYKDTEDQQNVYKKLNSDSDAKSESDIDQEPGNISKSASDVEEEFEDAAQEDVSEEKDDIKSHSSDEKNSSDEEDDRRESSPSQVWTPPSFSQTPDNTSDQRKEISGTVYQNWGPELEEKTVDEPPPIPKRPARGFSAVRKEPSDPALIGTVYQNNPPLIDRSQRPPITTNPVDNPPPVPEKSYRSSNTFSFSAMTGSDEYHSNPSSLIYPNTSSQSSDPQSTNVEEAAELPTKKGFPPPNPQQFLPGGVYPQGNVHSTAQGNLYLNPYSSLDTSHDAYPSHQGQGYPQGNLPAYPGQPFDPAQLNAWMSYFRQNPTLLQQNPVLMQQYMCMLFYQQQQQQQQTVQLGAPTGRPLTPEPPLQQTSQSGTWTVPPSQSHKQDEHHLKQDDRETERAKIPNPKHGKKGKGKEKKEKEVKSTKETEVVKSMKEKEVSKDYYSSVCVSGLNPTVGLETLCNFLEVRSKVEVDQSSVAFNGDKSMAVVTFMEPVDVEKLDEACKKKKLAQSVLDVSAVDPVKHIIVSAEGDISEQILQEYFQNSAKSGGGGVARITCRDDGCYSIKFKKPEGVKGVLTKSEHIVSGMKLAVTPLYFTDDGEIYDVEQHIAPIPNAFYVTDMDSHIQQFLQQSPHTQERLNNKLELKFARVSVSGDIKVDCLLTQKTPNVRQHAKTWPENAKDILQEHLKEITHKIELFVSEDVWDRLIEYVDTTHIHESDTLLIIKEKNTYRIFFVGEKEIVNEVHIQTDNKRKAIEAEIERKKLITTEEEELSKPKIKLLKRIGVLTEVNSLKDDLEVITDDQSSKIVYTGVPADIMAAKLKIKENLFKFEKWEVKDNLSKWQIILLGTEPVQEILQEKLSSKGLTVELEFEADKIRVYVASEIQHQSINNIIESVTCESVITLDETSLNVLSTEKWEKECTEIQKMYYERVMISPSKDAKITITSTSDLHRDVKDRLELFISDNSIYTDMVDVTDEGVMKFITRHCTERLNDIHKDHYRHFVKLDIQDGNIIISGTKEGLMQARDDVETIVKSIGYQVKHYTEPGVNKVIRPDQDQLTEIENKCESVIMFQGPKQNVSPPPIRAPRRHERRETNFEDVNIGIKDSTPSNQGRQSPSFSQRSIAVQKGPFRCAENCITITLIRGDLARQSGDAIVCSVAQDLHLNKGAASKNLLTVGGQGLMGEIETKYPDGVDTGQLAIISGGNLQCQELYLGYLPDWKSSQGKVLREFMMECMRAANLSSYQTIVFPAMGTGQLGYPKDRVADIMYQCIIDFDNKCAGTSIKEVKIVCYHGDIETCEAFEDEEKYRVNPHLPRIPARQSSVKKGPYITKNKVKITIVKEEIGKHSADVLVCACNKSIDLTQSGSSAKSLLDNGGEELQFGCKVKYPDGIAHFGDFKSVPGGKLKCKEVYLTMLSEDEKLSQQTLCKFIKECMKNADQAGYTSIGFAAMGTGKMKYPAGGVAKNIYSEVKRYSKDNPNCKVKDVRCVLYPKDRTTIKAFEDYEKGLLNVKTYSSGSNAHVTSNHGITVSVKTASITKTKDDVIVISGPPNFELQQNKVSRAVLKEGGPNLQQEIEAKYPSGIKPGEVAVVGPGALPCKCVCIGTLPKYPTDPDGAEKALKELVMKCLEIASSKGHKSVSFPCLGTGYNGYPHSTAASLLYQAVQEFDNKSSTTTIQNVNFVALKDDFRSVQAFQAQEKNQLSQGHPTMKRISEPYSSMPVLSASPTLGFMSFGKSVAATLRSTTRIFKDSYEEESKDSEIKVVAGQKPNEVIIGPLTINVCGGDLTEQKVDAIVNSTNLDLDFSQGGVSAAIRKKCDQKKLDAECADKASEMKKKKMIATSGCGLGKIKHIIHIECQDSLKSWQKIIKQCLEEADRLQCTSVALPVVGTGSGYVKFKPDSIGEMFYDAVHDFVSDNSQSTLSMVRIVAFQVDMVFPITEAIKSQIGKTRKTGIFQTIQDFAGDIGVVPKKGVTRTPSAKDNGVMLWIYSESARKRRETIDEVDKFIANQCTESSIEDRLFDDLNQSEWDKIYSVEDDFSIQLQEHKGKHKITLEGTTADVSSAKDKIYDLLRKFQRERFLDEEAKHVASFVEWSVMVKDQTTGIDKLEPYPMRENMYIENAYNKKESQVTLKTVDGDIIVDLSNMKEYPVNNPQEKDNVVRKEKVTGAKIELPAHWTIMDEKETIRVVTLLPSSQEYIDTEKKFKDSVLNGAFNTGRAPIPSRHPVGQFNGLKVHKIERIQNPSLFQQYSAKKTHIEKHVQQGTTLEQELWHGAPPTAIVSINYYGFNRSYCGNNAGEPWYGYGVYFANDASYSARDWVSGKDASGKKKMYLAKVVTGHYCLGTKGMKYLPERHPGVVYDCAVNEVNNPMEFVIFNDTQAYPEYCVEFTI